MNAETRFDPSVPLATATVQDIHLELMRRSEHNAFHGARVLADLLAQRQDWQAVLFDTYGLATDRGLPARLLKLRDMAANDYNANTLYMLAVAAAAAQRLGALAEAWGAEPICIKASYLPFNHGFRPREHPPYHTHSLQVIGDSFGVFFFVYTTLSGELAGGR